MAAHSRPQSRASTTSATSQHVEEFPPFARHEIHLSQPPEGPEAALLQYGASMGSQSQHPMYHETHHPLSQQISHHHAQSAPFPSQQMSLDSPYLPQDQLPDHMRVGSVPPGLGAEMTDDKRRKGSAVTATNDKELREMLAKNEGRQLRDVAQEVIQKERTPMAEKTKQLFAMLWYVNHPL